MYKNVDKIITIENKCRRSFDADVNRQLGYGGIILRLFEKTVPDEYSSSKINVYYCVQIGFCKLSKTLAMIKETDSV